MTTDPHRLRAPREDRAVVCEPPLEAVDDVLARNREHSPSGVGWLGIPWSDLREEARREMRAAAFAYLRAAGEPLPPPADGSAPVLMAGHQPELFHPGVWVKNFALQGLARRHHAAAFNLVVDNDTPHDTLVRVPVPPREQTHLVHVPFDTFSDDGPYEERPVLDEARFAGFADRVTDRLGGWDFEPMLPTFWEVVREKARHTPLLGERFAAARRAFERRWGCHNAEVPVSALCRTRSFARFAGHLIRDLPRFLASYNGCVQAYRRRYGLRSRNHPVPDLAADGDWLEAPFWAWRHGDRRRARLFVRHRRGMLELRAGQSPGPSLPDDPLNLPGAWEGLEAEGFKVRSRALTNTLFARLALCDLFLHGIGGGKYDEVTDAILRDYYHVEPPTYLVLSATLLLPLPGYPDTGADLRRAAHEVRDLIHNPQRHLPADRAAELVSAKRNGIDMPVSTAAERRTRYRVLREATARLQPLVADALTTARERLRLCDTHVARNAVLRRRDFSFCLFPEAPLREFCAQFLGAEVASAR